MKYALLLIFLPLFVFSQVSKPTPNPMALELNKRAFKLLLVTSDRDVKANAKILNILDSATNIDPKYNPALTNKLRPLLSLKKYSLALETIKKAIKNNPEDINLYIKEGVMYECFFSKKNQAISSYKKAYDIILQKGQKKSNKISSYDQELAYVLVFYKGKSAAINYLDKVSPKYKDQKNLKQISQLRQLISGESLDCEGKKAVFNKFTT